MRKPWKQLFAILIVAACADISGGKDVVTVTSDEGQSRRKGRVIDYTGRGLILETKTGRITIEPARVVRIETRRCNKHRVGDLAFKARQYAKAIDSYQRAVQGGDEPRGWVRREMLASVIQCHQALGHFDEAARYFVELLHVDPKTPHFHIMPLAWTTGHQIPTRRRAVAWLADETDGVRLVGASYLLATPHRDESTHMLEKLTTSSDMRVAALAEVQLLRARMHKPQESDAAHCQQQIDRLPPSLRAGPYYVLGRLHLAKGRHRQAAVAMMHVPILYPRQELLAAEALLAAGKSLAETTDQSDALRVLQELIDQYPKTAAATEAKQKREQLMKDS